MARRFLDATFDNLKKGAESIAAKTQGVSSSAIESLSYDFMTDEVIVNFTDGSSYAYHNVDMDSFVGLRRARSKGSYFNANIRNNYSYSRIG